MRFFSLILLPLLAACAPGGLYFTEDRSAEINATAQQVASQLAQQGYEIEMPYIIEATGLGAVAQTYCVGDVATIVVDRSSTITPGLMAHELAHVWRCQNGGLLASKYDNEREAEAITDEWMREFW